MDRIALCEVWSCLAHDYGLYGINTRLDRMGFKPAPALTYDTLDEEQQLAYSDREPQAIATGPYSPKIGQGGVL